MHIFLICGLTIFCAFLLAFRRLEGTWLPPAFLFVFGYFASVYIFVFHKLYFYTNYSEFAYENMVFASGLSTVSFLALYIGYLLHGIITRRASSQCVVREFMGPREGRIFRWILLVWSLFYAFLFVQSGVFDSVRGENAYVADAAVTTTQRVSFIVRQLYVPLIVAMFLVATTSRQTLKRKNMTATYLAASVLVALTLLAFNRHSVVYLVFAIGMIYHYRVRRVPVRYAVAAMSVLFLLQTIRGLRGLGLQLNEMSYIDVMFYFTNLDLFNLTNLFVGMFAGLAGFEVLTNVINYVPQRDEYFYGMTYVNSVAFLFLPRALGLSSYEQELPSVWYMNVHSPGTTNHGFDFSMLAEAYINFGVYMPLVFVLLGALVGRLSFKIKQTKSPGVLLFCVLALVNLTFALRSDSNVFVKSVFYHAVPILLLVYVLKTIRRPTR